MTLHNESPNMTHPIRSVLFLALFLANALPAFAQRGLKNIPPPDPEIERKSFQVLSLIHI